LIAAVDAVYAMAHAVHRMIADVCGHDARELCDELKPAPSGRNLLKYIRNVNFIGKYIGRFLFLCVNVSLPLGILFTHPSSWPWKGHVCLLFLPFGLANIKLLLTPPTHLVPFFLLLPSHILILYTLGPFKQ
jgi:hypothetical protein